MKSEESSEEGPVDLPKGKTVAQRFLILEKLGEGGCGAVYKVEDLEKGNKYAMKVESNSASGGAVLKLEVAVLKKLKNDKGHFAHLIHAGKRKTYSYMVMTLVGASLSNLIKRSKREMSISTTVRVGIQILYCLKSVHDAGYIHRDVKPGNVAIGREYPENRFLITLDFGLAREYVFNYEGRTVMRVPREKCLFRGTVKYCSITTHEKKEQGRADDLWSLVYMMAELRGGLPWEKLENKKDVYKKKLKTSDPKLLANCPVQLLDITSHLRALSYDARPDYLYIYKKLREVMTQGGYTFGDRYDWEKQKSTFLSLLKRKNSEDDTQGASVFGNGQTSPSFQDSDFSSNPLGF